VSAERLTATEEIFVLEGRGEDRYTLYAPLRRAAALVNGSAAHAVRRFLTDGVEELDPDGLQVVELLRGQGLLRGEAPEPPTSPGDYLFRPYEVTLFPTTRCNLRCIYCYADAGMDAGKLSWEAAQAAIDFVADNAATTGRDDFVVGFHGGGEPTLCWDLIERSVEHAEQRAEALGLTARIHAASNGVLSAARRRFIADHFTGMNISLDGPRDIQDRQRPLADGVGSFDAVMETVRHFEELGFAYGVRATVTAHSAPRLGEIVRFFRTSCPSLDQLHVEPVWFCGRCRTSGERPPEDEAFIAHFLDAWEEGERLGLRLFYSGARLDTLTNKFCAAPGDGFSITPEGMVSSCFEVTASDDPRARVFHYGRFDAEAGRYLIDQDRIERLRRLTVEHLPFCRDCFCRWHCAGDCLAKALPRGDPETHQGSSRCTLNRALTLAELQRILERAENRPAEGRRRGTTHAQASQ
jgi:uncharacterized protein